jgi:alanyl-tRNA synthetase
VSEETGRARVEPRRVPRKLYREDAYLRRFTADVAAVRAIDGRPAVALTQTAFYPTAGGQPCDQGRLGRFTVTEVREDDDEVWHVVDGEPAPAVGESLDGVIDWERRFDHMQQHTGQHVLSQALLRVLDAQTVSVHMGATCTIDIAVPSLDDAGAARVEALANTIVMENRVVRVQEVDADRVAELGLRRPPKVTGPVRVVEVEDFDRSACGGTHVRACGEIGPIVIRGWERYKGGVRVDFLCGWRTFRDIRSRMTLVRDLAGQFSVGEPELRDTVLRLRDRAKDLERDLTEARARLLDYEAAALVETARGSVRPDDVLVIAVPVAGRSIEELRALARAVTTKDRCIAIFGTDPDRRLIVARSAGITVDAAAILREALGAHGGRGGGKPEAAEGMAAAAPSASVLVEAARDAARRHLTPANG